MYNEELALNNQQWLICHKTKPNHLTVCKKKVQAHFKMLFTKCVYKSYIFNMLHDKTINILRVTLHMQI